MFKTFRKLFSKKNKDLRNRVLYTLAALIIFSLGNTITVPGMKEITGNLGFLELLNAISGGGLKQFSIFALSVTPYITGSIIIQLLAFAIPALEKLSKQGEDGKKINKITRYVGIAFAFLESYVYTSMFMGSAGLEPLEYVKIAIILTAGTAFLLWLGDQITNKGIGNGISLIIMAGIINTTPQMFIEAYNSLIASSTNISLGILTFALYVILYIGIIVGVVFIQEAIRKIPIQYSNRTVSSYGGRQTFLPLRINSAGVMPVIFASAILAVPTTLTYFIKSSGFVSFVTKYLTTTTPIGFVIYIVLIFVFTYFYTYVAAVNPEDLSKNLNQSGGYIPGIRPGKETTKYISKELSRITFLGAIFISIIAALPIIFSWVSSMPSIVSLGGTSILIVVGVLLETYKQIESSVASRAYKR